MSDDRDDEIVREIIAGKKASQIARERGMTVPEVNRVLDQAAAREFSASGLRRTMMLEAERLHHLKHQLWVRAMEEGDLHAAAVFIKASERLASMIGLNHPHGHIVTVTSTLEPVEHASSTQRMLEAIRLLRGETAAPEEDDDTGGP